MNITANKEISRVSALVKNADSALKIWNTKTVEFSGLEHQEFMLGKMFANVVEKMLLQSVFNSLQRLNKPTQVKVLNIISNALQDCDSEWRIYMSKIRSLHGECNDTMLFRKQVLNYLEDIDPEFSKTLFSYSNWIYYKKEQE